MNTNKNRRRWPYVVGGMVAACVLGAGTATAAGGLGPTDWLDLRSPNGTVHRVTVGDDGKLTAAPQTPIQTPTASPTASPTSTTPTATPTTTAPVITYAGAWQKNGTDTYTNTAGDKATITFTGTALTVTGFKASHHKNAVVTVDGASKGSTTSVAATRTEGTIYAVTGLTVGVHTAVLTATGTFSITGATSVGASTTSPTASHTTTAPTSSPTASPTSATQVPSTGIAKITISGNKFMANGKENWVVGVNSFTLGGGCGTAAEVAAAKAQGKAFIDSMRHDGHGVLRLFYWSEYNTATKAAIQDIVNYAGSRNVYSILTLSDGQKGCGNAGPSTLSANNYAHVKEAATRFKDNDAVLQFEVANEPTSSQWSEGFLDKVKGTYAAIKAIDSDRIVGSGTQASYFIGGTDRQAQINAVVDSTSLHGYEPGCGESRVQQELSLAQGKPMIMGEFGLTSTGSTRAAGFQCKLDAWKPLDGFAGALAWAYQPGSPDGGYGTIDRDPPTLKVLREASLG